MDLYNRQCEQHLLEEVEDAAVWPISGDVGETHTSSTLIIIRNGPSDRFNGASSISFLCRRTMRLVTLIEWEPTWHSDEELEMGPPELIKRIAVLMLRDLDWEMGNRQNLSVALAIRGQTEIPQQISQPSSQDASVDSNSDYTAMDLDDPENIPEDIMEDIMHDIEANLDDSTIQQFSESLANEGNSYIEFPFPSIPARCAQYFGHYVRQGGSDAGLGGHPSITYYCRRTRYTVTLAVPQSWDISTVPFPERIIQGAVIYLFRNMRGIHEAEAILDERLVAHALEWAVTEFGGTGEEAM